MYNVQIIKLKYNPIRLKLKSANIAVLYYKILIKTETVWYPFYALPISFY